MRALLMIGTGLAVLSLGACGGKPSAVASAADTGQSVSAAAGYGSVQQTAAPMADGKPVWAANRRHSAAENAQYQFNKNGGEFGARDEQDYILKVHAFVERPPRDAQVLDRDNGDRLIYAPGVNTFAVVSRDGAPRTMFKPRNGSAYWAQQKALVQQPAGGGAQG